MPPIKKSRGYKKAACTALMRQTFAVIGLRGKHHVPPEGISVVCNRITGVRLQAHHITGKEVNFDDESLHDFLVDLATFWGVGWLKKYEEVEYEYVDTDDEDEDEVSTEKENKNV